MHGEIGLGNFLLCRNSQKLVNHLMVDYNLSKFIRLDIRKFLSISQEWEVGQLLDYFGNSYQKANTSKELLSFISWGIWKLQNKALFELSTMFVGRVIHQALNLFKSYHVEKLPNRSSKILNPLVSSIKMVGLFDGASQGNGSCGGGGNILSFGSNTCFELKMGWGYGTNTWRSVGYVDGVTLWVS